MSVPNEIKNLTKEVIVSFGSGIATVGHLIEQGLEILDGYRKEEEAVRGSLRESLASIGSLRRKDFDDVMEGILVFQSQKEAEIKTLIKGFLGKQRDLTNRLGRCLEAGIFDEVERIKTELAKVINEAREEILSFQKDQEKIRKTFLNLEAKKAEISPREFKKVINDLEEELTGPFPLVETEQKMAAGAA